MQTSGQHRRELDSQPSGRKLSAPVTLLLHRLPVRVPRGTTSGYNMLMRLQMSVDTVVLTLPGLPPLAAASSSLFSLWWSRWSQFRSHWTWWCLKCLPPALRSLEGDWVGASCFVGGLMLESSTRGGANRARRRPLDQTVPGATHRASPSTAIYGHKPWHRVTCLYQYLQEDIVECQRYVEERILAALTSKAQPRERTNLQYEKRL